MNIIDAIVADMCNPDLHKCVCCGQIGNVYPCQGENGVCESWYCVTCFYDTDTKTLEPIWWKSIYTHDEKFDDVVNKTKGELT